MPARYNRSPPEQRTFNGRLYDSIKEANHAKILQSLARTGAIKNLREQVPFIICPAAGKYRAMHYRADFVFERDGETVIQDVKGHRTQLYLLKKRLLLHFHGIEIEEV